MTHEMMKKEPYKPRFTIE